MPGFDDVRLKHSRLVEAHVGTETVLRSNRRYRAHVFRRHVAIIVTLVCLGAPCRAQPATTTAAPAPEQAVVKPPVSLPPPPDAANPTPEHVAKARRLILATGISRSFTIMVAEFMDQIGNTFTQARPDLVRDMNKVLDQLRPEFDKQSDEMIDQSARIYATLLSEKDIDTILAFFNSEAGKRYVGLQPLFLNQLLSGTQAWQQKIAINMMARVREEMKKKGHDL